MTALVIEETGEVVEQISRVEAERITARIADKLDTIADNYEQVVPLIREALTRGAHEALGYASVQAYVSERFAGAFGRLPREVRRPIVVELSALGMSTRAIAPIVSTSQKTVVTDLQVIPEVSRGTHEGRADRPQISDAQTTAPDAVDVRRAPQARTPVPTAGAQPLAPEHQVVPEVDEQAGQGDPPTTRPVIGLDGKTYTRPTPVPTRQERRPPLPDQFFKRMYDAEKKIRSLAEIAKDDRFPQNAEKLARNYRDQLIRSRDLLQQVIDSLPQQGV